MTTSTVNANVVASAASYLEPAGQRRLNGDAPTPRPELASWDAVRDAYGLSWEPVAAPVLTSGPNGLPVLLGIDQLGNPVYETETDHKKIVRNDTWLTLGVPGSGYEVLDHTLLGRIIAPVMEAPGAEVRMLRELRGGRSVMGLIELTREARGFAGDPSPWTLSVGFQASHDGNGSLRVWGTAERLWCTNQWNTAMRQASATGRFHAIRHTRNAPEQIEQASHLVGVLRRDFDEFLADREDLHRRRVTVRQRDEFVDRMIPLPEQWADMKDHDHRIRRVHERRGVLHAIFSSNTMLGVELTAGALVEAAGELADWGGNQTVDGRIRRTQLEQSTFKATALREALSLAA
ncbi:DUF932 domain-containing protein [Streptomyces sp. H10-C2]|uniref:DUF932 domain-containing protein n=1 Tax=unclassified Streptomyces TaxID=2593676 RepID=UPI0024BB8F4D|nr:MULTISPECIES: DUF932 domain-containing protein [unclassified Streptomyces]MDJ0346813.1 DUF932 domain-containing protein [Streptomyces sp. PH10-H1]MDJ0375784.1 DUF932 domain-containing protein [Streptomyces sp. H10-C2]